MVVVLAWSRYLANDSKSIPPLPPDFCAVASNSTVRSSAMTMPAPVAGDWMICSFSLSSAVAPFGYLLQKWIDWGIHGYYWTADTNSPNLRQGSNPRWANNSIWVLAPYCTTGTWRSRSNLYVTGSSYGRFRPYPFVTVPLPVYLEC